MEPASEEPFGAIPDDAAELEPDRQLWLAEQAPRTGWRRLIFTRRWDRFGLSGPIVVLCLLATSLVGALAVIFVPRPAAAPAPAPLAAVELLTPPAGTADPTPPPAVENATRPGTGTGPVAGRRLPEVRLEAEQEAVLSTELRPGVIALLPPTCACARSLTALLRQAAEFQLRFWMIAEGPGRRTELTRLDEATGGGAARWGVDAEGELAAAARARGLTVLLVQADGMIRQVRRDIPRDGEIPALEPVLARLPKPLKR
jgi:hypothetical protein